MPRPFSYEVDMSDLQKVGIELVAEDGGFKKNTQEASVAIDSLIAKMKEAGAAGTKFEANLGGMTDEAKQIVSAMKSTSSAISQVEQATAGAVNSVDKYTNKQKELRAVIGVTEAKLQDYKFALAAVEAAYAKNGTEKQANDIKKFTALISKTEAELNTLDDELRRNTAEYGKLSKAVDEATIAEKAITRAVDAKVKVYEKNDIVIEKYNIKLRQQAMESERLNEQIKEEVVQLNRLAAAGDKDADQIKERSNNLAKLNQQLQISDNAIKAYAHSLDNLSNKNVILTNKAKDAFRAMEEQGQGIRDIGFTIRDTGIAMSAFVTLPYVVGMKAAISASIEFEQSFTSILKTVDGVVAAGTLSELTEQGEQLRDAMLTMSLAMPVAADELNNVASIAGQLGVKAKDIAAFTQVVVEFGTATDVSSENAGKAFAQVFNVFKRNLGETADIVKFTDAASNAIVYLGNNYATTESEILSFFQTFAGGAAAFKVTAQDALAISAAFKSVRAQTASSSTGIQKTFLNMSQAVIGSTDKLEEFATISGMTADEFAATWRSRPAEAFSHFLQGLAKAGDQAPNILKDLGLGDVRIQREFLKAAAGADVLVTALEESSVAFGNFGQQGARAVEAARRFATVESQLELLANEFKYLAISIGDAFLPVIRDMISSVKPAVEALAEFTKQNPELVKTAAALGAVAAAIGPLAIGIGGMASLTGGLKAGIGSLNLGIQAMKLATNATNAEVQFMVDKSKTITGIGRSLSQAMGGAAQALAVTGVAAAGLVAALVAVTYVMKEVNEANKNMEKMVETSTQAVDTFAQFTQANLDMLAVIVMASDSWADYEGAIDAANFAAGDLTEAQWELLKAHGEEVKGLTKTTAALEAYRREMEEANWIARTFASFEGGTLAVMEIAEGETNTAEEYLDVLLQIRDAEKRGIKKSIFANNHEGAIEKALQGILEKTNDTTFAAEALIEVSESEIAVFYAITKGMEANNPVLQAYHDGTVGLKEVIDELIRTEEEYKLGLSAVTLGVQQFLGELSEQELVTVATGRAMGNTEEQIIRTIATQRMYTMALREAAIAAAESTTGVEGMIGVYAAAADAAEFGAKVGELFAEALPDTISLVQSLSTTWENFQKIASGEIDGSLADNFMALHEGSEALGDSYARLALEAEKIRLTELGYSIEEVEDSVIEYSVALGLMTEAQGQATRDMLYMNGEMQLLVTAFGALNEEGTGQILTLKQQAAAVELLSGGFVDTADDAFKLVQADEQLVDMTIAAANATKLQSAAMAKASDDARELAQEYIRVAEAQNAAMQSSKDAIRDLFSSDSGGGGAAAVEKEVELAVDAMAETYEGFIEVLQDGEAPVENWSKLLLKSAVAGGASLEQIVALTIATGELSDEQAKGLLNQVAAMKAVEQIADAYVRGEITADQAAGAVKGMQEQLAAGGAIDLGQYGVFEEKVEAVAEAATGASKSVKSAQEELAASVISIIGSFEELSDAQIRELEVEFGIISLDQADAENKYQNALEAMRTTFGRMFVDGVEVSFGLNVLGIENSKQYFDELYLLAQSGADAAGAMELVVGVSADLALSDVDSKAFYEKVTAALMADPETAAIDVVANILLEGDIEDEGLTNFAAMANSGLEVTATYVDEGLTEYLTDIQARTENIAGEEVVHNVLYATNIADEMGPLAETEALKNKILEVSGEGKMWYVRMNDDEIVNALGTATTLMGKMLALDGFVATVKIKVEADQIPDYSGGGSDGNGDTPENYHGGLLRGKLGRDKFLSWVSNGEYVMPNYVTNKPGVLSTLEKIRSTAGAWTPTMGQQRLYANTGNGATSNSSTDNSVRSNKSVVININGQSGRNTRSNLLAFTNLNRI